MAEDLVELGLEAFDFVTDRYHDNVYDGVGRVGPWIKERRTKTRIGPDGKKEQVTVTVNKPRDMAQGQAVAPNDRGRRYSGGDKRRTRSRGAPDIRVEKVEKVERVDDDRGSKSHIYPPAPGPMAPPYPTPGQGAAAGALVAMPPDAPYPGERGGLNRRPVYRSDNSESDDSGYDDDRDRRQRHRHRHRHHRSADERSLRRSHSEYGPRQRSKSRRRGSRDDRSDSDRYQEKSGGFDSVAATLTGAVAGGFLGRGASKGDTLATVAGAIAGAFTANVAERQWEKHNRQKEDRWEEKWGYRS